jgi:hypothetical protein
MNEMSKRLIRRRCWFLPALAVLLAWPLVGAAQGIIYDQLPPSPSLGLVQDPTTGQWVDPFAPYDAQGLRLWGSVDSPVSYNLVIDGQVAFTFTSGYNFEIDPVGNNKVIGGYLDDLGATGAAPLSGGYQIGADAGEYTWLGDGSLVLATARASDTIGSPILFSGPFAGVASGYIGLEFYVDDEAYYGWVRVGAPATINGGWIYDYAYETAPNTSIFAGEVPEPSIVALLLGGGISFAFFRRGRKLTNFIAMKR